MRTDPDAGDRRVFVRSRSPREIGPCERYEFEVRYCVMTLFAVLLILGGSAMSAALHRSARP